MATGALTRVECMKLLGQATIGRVGVTLKALPWIFPVPFQVVGEGLIVFGVTEGSPLARATDGAVVAFEADSFDGDRRIGWTVRGIGESAPLPDGEAPGSAMRASWVLGESAERLRQLELGQLSGYRTH